MAKSTVRCVQCGAKNKDVIEERCRLCGFLLPDFQRRRLAAAGASEGQSFAASVEDEVGVWQNYGANGVPRRTHIHEDDGSSGANPLTLIAAVVLAVIVVLGAAQLLI